ncbi:MAG: ATP-binding protein [Thermoguttaceae bacterium]
MSSRVSTNDGKKVRVLLISEDAVDSRWLKQLLGPDRSSRNGRQGSFIVSRTDRNENASESLMRHHFDAILIDLGLLAGDDLQPISKIIAAAPHLPLIVLAGFNNDGFAIRVIRLGAQECLFKDALEARLLKRTIHHAIQRKANESKLAGHARELESARARLEQQAAELRSCMEQLDRINHELEDFTYIASHDLKEPLRGISSYCEILLEDYRHKLDAEGKRRLTTAIHLCDRTENLIDDLLTYCRVGRKAAVKTRVNLNAVTANLLKMLRPSIERRNAAVRIAGPLPPVVGNATLIGMVLCNLISNGLKFNENRRPHVELGWVPTDPVAFYVKDNGIGIAKEHHEAIFTIFRRLHSRKKYEGSGAGLTIVRKIVELHGGRIWLESAPGAGTTFYFTLSRCAETGAAEHALPPPHWTQQNRARRITARMRDKQTVR